MKTYVWTCRFCKTSATYDEAVMNEIMGSEDWKKSLCLNCERKSNAYNAKKINRKKFSKVLKKRLTKI